MATALAKEPGRETALLDAALIAMQRGELDTAYDYLQRFLTVNPWRPRIHFLLARVHEQRSEWPEALAECRAELKINPFSTEARTLLVDCLVRIGERQNAKAELDTLLRMRPPNEEALRRWYARELP